VLLLVLVLENAHVWPSEQLNKIIMGGIGFLFSPQKPKQIEHEHDDEHEHDSPTAYSDS
jgi:hypothetical protein